MDIKGANTESFYRFLRFQENLGTNIKLAYGALQEASRHSGARLPDNRNALMTLPTGGEPWGNATRWKDIKPRIPLARRFLSQTGLVLVASGFQDFVDNTISEHTRFSKFIRKEASPRALPTADVETSDYLSNLYALLQWNIKPIEYLLPLFKYFMVTRNCVAHRSGRASKGLVAYSESQLLSRCLRNWPSRHGKTIPELPQVHEGREIPLLPRHAILFSEVCLRAAVQTNNLLSAFLGVDGMVYMAAHYGLLADDPIQTNARRLPEGIINVVLTGRYRVRVQDTFEVIGILKRLNIWNECRSKHHKLYAKVRK
jgi:hypothetical protein